ncbi:MAG: cache domain-containing protein [Burkholderiales bacterium]|nr:cache domain-containing protein [Burkholderiales bacterium]
MVLLPLFVVLPILIGLVVYWGSTSYDGLLIFKINSDLVIANRYFQQVLHGLGSDVDSLARSRTLHAALQTGNPTVLNATLADAKTRGGFDFIYYLAADGRPLASAGESRSAPDAPANHIGWPVVASAGKGGAQTQIDIFSEAQLTRIDPALAERANLKLVPTKNAAPTDRNSETRGMVVHAAAPVLDVNNKLVGILEAGLLLNRNLDFVDTINNIIYGKDALPAGSKGTATLFLDDVRIATNVRLFQGERALGTRVSQEVRGKVLGKGETWRDSAFVVNDWYVSGYEPIVDSFGKRVGMLYVGFLETPFREAKYFGMAAIVLLFLFISVTGAVWSLRWARAIFKPLERMNQTISAVEAGDSEARVGSLQSRDEIGELARHLDQLLATLQARNEELKSYADDLDKKVAERTQELEAANKSLRGAQKQLVMSEKLAAIGQLTAGVAHEINNPIAVIQGNLDLVRAELGPAAWPVINEIRLIDEQVNRIRLIVTKLLQFARPAEYAGYVEAVDVNTLMGDCLVLVRHELKKSDIEVKQVLQASLKAGINRNELQQVVINLLVNAVQAMPEQGRLIISTEDWEDKGVTIRVKDTGPGIHPGDLSRVFDAFFTTKKQQGTGLGLSISYAIVERYGGRITVKSEYGNGAAFAVWLLTEPRYQAEAVLPDVANPPLRHAVDS